MRHRVSLSLTFYCSHVQLSVRGIHVKGLLKTSLRSGEDHLSALLTRFGGYKMFNFLQELGSKYLHRGAIESNIPILRRYKL